MGPAIRGLRKCCTSGARLLLHGAQLFPTRLTVVRLRQSFCYKQSPPEATSPYSLLIWVSGYGTPSTPFVAGQEFSGYTG
jgi:hypothetical protein